MEFVPPFPHRPEAGLAPWALIRSARRNLLEIWDRECFELEFFTARLLTKQIFICNSPDTVQQAFVVQNDLFQRKSPQMRNALRPLLGDGLFISDGDTWKERRKLVAPAVNASRLPTFAPVMVDATTEFCDRLAQGPLPAKIEVLSEMASLTAEIICRVIFGRSLGRDAASEIVEAFSEYQRAIGQMDVMSLFGLPDWLPRLRGGGIAGPTRRIHKALSQIIASYEKDPPRDENSIMKLLMQRSETNARLTAEQLRNEIAVLFMAGHETTANSMAWTWYLLSQSPWAEARLHAELDRVLGGRPPTLDDYPQLAYARAVFEEALRLYPPVPLLSREAVRDGTVRGHKVRKGSLVLVVPWLLHRHSKLWDQPDYFMPERFLAENTAGRSKYAYIPFSIGPRTCAGAAFGLTEGVLCLATLAQRFRLKLDRPNPVMPLCRLTLRPEGGLSMIAVPRTACETPAAA